MQILAGLKTYLLAALAVAYAAYGFFFAHTLDQNTALGIVAAALGLGTMRSAVSTEVNKLLAGLGVPVTAIPSLTPESILQYGSKLVDALKVIATAPKAGKIAGAFLVMLLVSPVLTGCQTWDAITGNGGTASTTLCSTPSQCVYQAKGVFAASLVLANAYGALPACPDPTGSPLCKDPAIMSTIKAAAHETQTTLDAADLLVNSGLLPDGSKATADQIEAAAKGATSAAVSFKTQAAGLPH